jgi:UDP:flavonoid glycosyltransferase YjiC (YdhE family)
MLGTTSANITSPIGKLFIEILKTLNKTSYNVVAVYTDISSKDIPKIRENILLKQYLKYPQIVNKIVDLAIIHGGRGTVYNSAYSGKPSIGIPFFVEQQYNIDCLVRKKVCIRISAKYFKTEELLKAINTIFENYDYYLKNAKALSEQLSKEIDEEKAVNRLIQIIDKEIK